MTGLTTVLSIILYIFGIILLGVLIVLGIRLIQMLERADKILDNVEEKVNSLISRFTEDDMFTIKAKLTDDFDIEFTKNGKSLNMFSLSEGQKASITFAFTFAFQFLRREMHIWPH